MKVNIIQQPFILKAINIIKNDMSSGCFTRLQYTTADKWSIVAVNRITGCSRNIKHYEVKS